jgi:hypothetical protein
VLCATGAANITPAQAPVASNVLERATGLIAVFSALDKKRLDVTYMQNPLVKSFRNANSDYPQALLLYLHYHLQ